MSPPSPSTPWTAPPRLGLRQAGHPLLRLRVGPTGGACANFFPPYGCNRRHRRHAARLLAENRPVFLYAHKVTASPTPRLRPGYPGPGSHPGRGSARVTVAAERDGDRRALRRRPAPADRRGRVLLGRPRRGRHRHGHGRGRRRLGETTEEVSATLDTTGLPLGQHYLLLHGRNDDGAWDRIQPSSSTWSNRESRPSSPATSTTPAAAPRSTPWSRPDRSGPTPTRPRATIACR